MTYKVPYILNCSNYIYPVSFITAFHTLTKDSTVDSHPVQKMLVSLSDFSTHPIGRVLWEELLIFSRFHS